MAMEYAANGILKGIFDEGSFTELYNKVATDLIFVA